MKETKEIKKVLESVEGLHRADIGEWNLEFKPGKINSSSNLTTRLTDSLTLYLIPFSF